LGVGGDFGEWIGLRGRNLIGGDQLWREILPRAVRGRPALFLDRDGVVVVETDYLCRREDVALIPGAAEVVTAANRSGIAVVIVTNQAGIGRGKFGWAEFASVQETIASALAVRGAHWDAVYACPHHPDANGVFAHPDHPARKPNPGMILRAAADLAIDLPRSWLVGDKASDIEAARRAGLAGALHVATGYGLTQRADAMALATARFDVRTGRSIEDAMGLPILDGNGRSLLPVAPQSDR
jgi:D-glycero-D-manno-heptose 1,7-bisphosphate phosphatase